jgi:hypothetical protein
MTGLVLGAPVAAAASALPLGALLGIRPAAAADQAAGANQAAGAPPSEPSPTPLAKFLAKQDDELTSAERKRVRKSVTQIEEALKSIRDFKIGNDVPPSGTFRALKSGPPAAKRR